MPIREFELARWFIQAEGRYDLSLGSSDCEPARLGDVVGEAGMAALADSTLGYGEFDGMPELRARIAAQYESIASEDVMTFHGSLEAIYTFMHGVLNAEDRIVVTTPAYHPLHALARQLGCHVDEWRPRDTHSFEFDVDDLASLCGPTVKLIVMNFPHNPTGQLLKPNEWLRAVDIAKSCGAILFSDEVFRGLELPPQQTLHAACDLCEHAVSVSGLSKTMGMGGLRVGWVATRNQGIRDSMRTFRSQLAEMTTAPGQLIACHAIQRIDEIVAGHRQTIAKNLALLVEFAATQPVLDVIVPRAGTMALVRQRTGMTSTEFCQRLMDDERVFLVPGAPLDLSDNLLRFGLGRTDFAEGLERLERFL